MIVYDSASSCIGKLFTVGDTIGETVVNFKEVPIPDGMELRGCALHYREPVVACGVHYVVWRRMFDPVGVKVVGVRHNQEDAKQLLNYAAHVELAEAELRRRERFDAGEPVGRRPELKDFDHAYYIEKVF